MYQWAVRARFDGSENWQERKVASLSAEALKQLLDRVCCVVGLLSGAGGVISSILSASVNPSAGAMGIVLGLVGYFLGVSRLGVATIAVGVITLFFMAAASTGLIPSVTPPGHGYD
jgi:hypothetical protein